MLTYKINIQDIKNQIFIPKYYDPALRQELLSLKETHDLLVLGDLIDAGIIGAQTGHEIGKMAYGQVPSPLYALQIFPIGKSKLFQNRGFHRKYMTSMLIRKMFSPEIS